MTVIYLSIFAISIIYFMVLVLGFFNSSKLAAKYIDTGKCEFAWKISCYVKSFFIAYFLLWIAGLAVTIQIDTKFFTETIFGSILGMGVILNILASALWWILFQAKNSSINYMISSLEKTLNENPRDWKLRYFNRKKVVLMDDDLEARKGIITNLTLQNEPQDQIMNP